MDHRLVFLHRFSQSKPWKLQTVPAPEWDSPKVQSEHAATDPSLQPRARIVGLRQAVAHIQIPPLLQCRQAPPIPASDEGCPAVPVPLPSEAAVELARQVKK